MTHGESQPKLLISLRDDTTGGDSTGAASGLGSMEDDESEPCESDEVADILSDIAHVITCLYQLSFVTRNPIALERLHKIAAIDVSHFERRDIDHVSNEFPNAPGYLIQRMGKANTKRRQLMKYYESYHDNIARYADLPLTPNKRIKVIHDSSAKVQARKRSLTKREGFDTHLIIPKGPGRISPEIPGINTLPTVKELRSQSKVQTRKRKLPSIDIESGSDHSQISIDVESDSDYSQISSTNQKCKIHIPPPPNFNAAYDGKPFECPYCFHSITIDNAQSWK